MPFASGSIMPTRKSRTRGLQSRLSHIANRLNPNDRRMPALVRVLACRRPRLLSGGWERPLAGLSRAPFWLRSVESWRGAGTSAKGGFRSLVDHLLCRYAVPAWARNAFWLQSTIDQTFGVRFLAAIGRGASAYRAVQAGELWGIPLTRKAVHKLLLSDETRPFHAIRQAQVEAMPFAEELRNAAAWCWLRPVPAHEPFRASVLEWMARQRGLQPDQIHEIARFLDVVIMRDPTWSIRDRSLRSVLADVRDWRTPARRVVMREFASCGLQGMTVLDRDPHRGPFRLELVELRDSAELVEEGRRLRHCVGQYAGRVKNGISSIWSLRRAFEGDDLQPLVTIEYAPHRACIVRAKGYSNRSLRPEELAVIRQWAAVNRIRYRL